MLRLLFPGRHHLLTNFQLQYLTRATSGDPTTLLDVSGRPLGPEAKFSAILWVITSANHANTRRNPLPGHRREVAIEEFAEQLDVPSYVFTIEDLGVTPRFAEYVIKKIEVDSQGRFTLTPADTVVACSTPEVIELYEQLGFRVLPVELEDRHSRRFVAETPWHLLERFVQTGLTGADWRVDETYITKVSRATRRLYDKYGYGDLILDLHRSALLTDDGDLTETRDYNTYVRSFDEGAKRKYDLIKDHVLPGRIVDIGCCTGALIRELTHDERLRESDFYGVEVARQLYAECLHRKEQGSFANENVFFYQRDFAAGPLFTSGSINTFTTFSLTHEIESYAGRDALFRFMGLLYEQLAYQGRWINVDVVGPDDPQRMVYMWLNREDGRCDDYQRQFAANQRKELREYLDKLSTYGRFLRFAEDFRRDEEYRLEYDTATVGEQSYVVLTMRDAAEFLSKKDYTDNWQSEMHETFCYWSFADWCQAVEQSSFRVLPGSQPLTNPWLVENRYRGKAELLELSHGELRPIDYPATNILLITEKL